MEVSAWVQIFYAWRIHVMVHWKVIPIVIIIVGLLSLFSLCSVQG